MCSREKITVKTRKWSKLLGEKIKIIASVWFYRRIKILIHRNLWIPRYTFISPKYANKENIENIFLFFSTTRISIFLLLNNNKNYHFFSLLIKYVNKENIFLSLLYDECKMIRKAIYICFERMLWCKMHQDHWSSSLHKQSKSNSLILPWRYMSKHEILSIILFIQSLISSKCLTNTKSYSHRNPC